MAHNDILFYDHFEKCINVLDADDDMEIACTRPLWITRDGMIIPVEFNLYNPSTLENFVAGKHNAMPATILSIIPEFSEIPCH